MSGNNWGSGAGWDERNWDAVRQQEQKKQEILVKASQNSERIRQMVRQTDQTRQVAGETLTVLDQQSEQLKRMHGEVDKIEANLNFADRTIRGMESIWGSFKNYMTKGSVKSSRPRAEAEAEKLDQSRSSRQSNSSGRNLADSFNARANNQPKDYSSDWKGKLHKLEDQQENDLDDLSRMVGELKAMGKDMGTTLDSQTKSIERLSDRTDAVDSRLAKSNLRVKKMLG